MGLARRSCPPSVGARRTVFLFAVAAVLCVSCVSAPDRGALAAEYMVLAEGYAGLEKYDQALFFYKKASTEPSYKNAALYGMGRIYALTENWKEAVSVFASLYEQEPENEILISAYAYALVAAGDGERALPLYAEMMRTHPDDARFAVDYVELLFLAGLYDEAREEAAALEERFPNNPELASLGDIEERIRAAVPQEAAETDGGQDPADGNGDGGAGASP